MAKPFSFGSPVAANFQTWAQNALREIERSSYESVEAVFAGYSVTGDFVPTRTLNNDTPTLAELYALISTLIMDVQQLGTRN